jgi:hypothetical protein
MALSDVQSQNTLRLKEVRSDEASQDQQHPRNSSSKLLTEQSLS